MKLLKLTFYDLDFKLEQEEIFIARLSDFGFDSFQILEDKIYCFIEIENFKESIFNDYLSLHACPTSYKITQHEDKNWNSVWESDYKYVEINDICVVRAPFHKLNKKYDYEIVISPKMSFGTGHHETTQLMMTSMMMFDFSDKLVLDVGSGTGVLSILSSLMGAKYVFSIDTDENAVINCDENKLNNGCLNIYTFCTDVFGLDNKVYDIILANLNRNIILNESHYYIKKLKQSGLLILSGFLKNDMDSIIKPFTKNLKLIYKKNKNEWQCLVFLKL